MKTTGLIIYTVFSFVISNITQAIAFGRNFKRQNIKYRMTSLNGFSDPNWNWGSSNGSGHEAAMKLRFQLGDTEKRKSFIKNVVNTSDIDFEDIKLALALRFQRASREGKGGSDEGYIIMTKMANRKYEGGKSGESRLLFDLEELLLVLPSDLVSEAGSVVGGGGHLNYTAAKVLCGMNFKTAGL